MSDAAQPTAAEVRAAAEAVKAALDRHLDAVEARTGEDDPAVYNAFNALAAAAEAYDEKLYDRYDEVTPFEIPGADDSLPPYAGPDEPHALSVLIRRDYAVVEPQRLLAQAQRIVDLDPEADSGSGVNAVVGSSVHAALGVLFGEYEPDEVASRHQEFGLEEGTPRSGSPLRTNCPSRGSGWKRPSTAPTRSRSCAASTSAPSSTTRTCSTTGTTKATRRTASWTPSWRTTGPDLVRLRRWPGPRVPAIGCVRVYPAAGRSSVRSRVVRSWAGTSATARGNAWSTPCTTDR